MEPGQDVSGSKNTPLTRKVFASLRLFGEQFWWEFLVDIWWSSVLELRVFVFRRTMDRNVPLLGTGTPSR